MAAKPAETLGAGCFQEFVDTAITNPAELAALDKQLHNSRRRSSRIWWLVGAGAVAAIFLAGLIVGRWVFGSHP